MDQRQNTFDEDFFALSGFKPFHWQRRLFGLFGQGEVPAALDLPTGLGKTSVMAIWLIARAHGARLPRRLVYIVDRRAVVDQATEEAEKLRKNLQDALELKAGLGLSKEDSLPISTLRGRHADNREWLADPAAPAIIVGTVDMIGSRLLFSGYGVSRKMRSYHAGFLGADALVVLDEAHLVPPFEKLLGAIEEGEQIFGPAASEDRAIVPGFRLLSLSATGRERKGDVFRLCDADIPDVEHRLKAPKTVTIVKAGDDALEEVLADQAWSAAQSGASNVRCLIYCDSRGVAEKTEKAIKKRAGSDKKRGAAAVAAATELFVGARRTREREKAREWLLSHGFLAGSPRPQRPAFLIATSAGEVGIDLDADHMVCDLVPWERMVQRLGRVNRRGSGEAGIAIIDQGEPKPKKAGSPTASETRAAIAYRVLPIIEALPTSDQGFDASPAALRELKLRAVHDKALGKIIDDATTPAPLWPALSRPLVEAWSMTSLEDHPGRPNIEPWLRGWTEEDEQQTTVAWRAYLPVRDGERVTRQEVNGFFEAAPPHASELLETETWRVVEWLLARAKASARPDAPSPFRLDSIVAFVLTPDRQTKPSVDDKWPLAYSISDLLPGSEAATRLRDRMERELAGTTLVVDARIGGLATSGLLDEAVDTPATSADADGEEWLPLGEDGRPVVRFRIHSNRRPNDIIVDMHEVLVFAIKRSIDGQDELVHLVETWTTEESRASSIRAQWLDEHHAWTGEAAAKIAKAVELDERHARALVVAARLHDEGKKAERWQRAFNAPSGKAYAKTKGPLNLSYLDGYRHEFGSLPLAEANECFHKLPEDLKDLVLHLIAAHHGFARPLIEARSCDDAPPSALQDRVRHVALRFANLQKRWGPWGLAWWEALLRSADQQASRRNDRAGGMADG
jgi:CRISPR-associated endonuclease/helicase Cas3